MLRIFIHVLFIIVPFQHVNAQETQNATAPSNTRHILILNKKHEPFKEINIGDKVRLILTNSTRVKGQITSIDSTFFTVDNNVVHLNEIGKISTKKIWVQGVVGTVLLAGGLALFVDNFSYSMENYGGGGFLGAVLTGAAIATMLPGYHKIGTSNWFVVISNKPNIVDK